MIEQWTRLYSDNILVQKIAAPHFYGALELISYIRKWGMNRKHQENI